MWIAEEGEIAQIARPTRLLDLGNLMLTFVMLWAYTSFSQFLIIWSGNLPDENPWYIHRLAGGWQWIALVLVVFHFAVPFLLLLSRYVKRRDRAARRHRVGHDIHALRRYLLECTAGALALGACALAGRCHTGRSRRSLACGFPLAIEPADHGCRKPRWRRAGG